MRLPLPFCLVEPRGRLGIQQLVAVVGEDFPREHRTLLSERGVDCSGLKTAKGKTFRWSGKYGKDANVAKKNIGNAFAKGLHRGDRREKCMGPSLC